ncbi:MAG TPA: indoleacetamide hydrolase [Burkholderiaceae bacterium]|nr:indoleacetamide hydrolase [Burkholderiaceae bacterium]
MSRRWHWVVRMGSSGALAGAAAVVAAQGAPSSAANAAEDVCAGKLSSEQLVSAALARAKERADLNAFVTLDEAGALAAAKRIDASKGHPRCRPLAGVPIVVKDNIEVARLPSTGGTPALKGYVPKADAPVVKKLRDAGAIVLGKTNMHELAFGISGYNPAYNTGSNVGIRNAYDPSRSAGGSSSGTGAALGARVVMAGLGTDTGGSVRIPCAFNGCAALRPTVGRYSQKGILPISHTRDTAGPMALAMADVELLDRVISGAKPEKAADLKSVRVGLVKDFQANLDADTQAAFDAAIAKAKAAGVTVVDVQMPKLMELNGAVSFPVALYEAYDDVVKYLNGTGTKITLPKLAETIASADVKGTYQGLVIPRKLPGPNNTVVDAKPAYDAAIKTARPALQKLYADTFKQYKLDALVFPTVPKVAMPANPESSSVPVFLGAIQNTDPGSNAGVPGLQIPIALGATSKLPIGLELDGPAGSDRRLVAIGLALEPLFGQLPAPAR